MKFNSISAIIPFISLVQALEHGSEYANSMGEIAMLYPGDREWSEEAETVAPCGSYASVVNRTDFPLDKGFVALVAKSHQAWSVSLKISYKDDPTDNADFDEWASGNVTNEIDIGHTCFYMPDPPSSINAGDFATIQLEYMALEDDANETHYACSDIKFVEDSVFKVTEFALDCFNATDDDYYSYSDYGESSIEDVDTEESSASSESATSSSDSSSASSTATSSSSSSTSSSTSSSSSASSASSASSSSKGEAIGLTNSIGLAAVMLLFNLM
ncbi:DEKNAAC102810 [Brettanomyces naardenensis]|uniref:DEKNAAC102810 n=1 Tax=Brettanomyces naardenensis TaxID=13370 RepID=A0A448YLS9_BRENA|nr:DEKNAAC102810 [Brettanomyces naardenensis]